MAIQVRSPDGSTVNFPDETPSDTIDQVMRTHFGSPDTSASIGADPRSDRERFKQEIRAGGDQDGNYSGTQTPVPGFFGLLQRKMSDPFGVQDEIVGGGKYVGRAVHRAIYGDEGQTPDQAYTEGSERIRAEKEIGRERLGWGGNLAAELAGGFGTSGVGSKVAQQGLGVANRLWQTAKAGGKFGFLSGFGNTDGGDFYDRLEGGAKGAGEGAILGPAISEVGAPVVNALARNAVNAVPAIGNTLARAIPGTRANVDDILLRAARRQGMSIADIRAQNAQDVADATFQGGTTMDIPTTLADSGVAMRNLAATIKRQPGPAATEADRVMEGRQRGQNGFDTSHYDRMAEATRRSLKVTNDNAARTESNLEAGQSAGANTAYNAYRNSGVTIPVEDILQSHAQDTAQNLTTGSKLFADIDNAYAPFVDEPHSLGVVQGPSRTQEARHNLAQMQLDDRIAKATEAGDTAKAAELGKLKQGLTDQYGALTKNANLTAPTSDLTPAKFDNAKRQLGDQITAAIKEGNGYKVSLLKDLEKRLIGRADEATAILDANGQPVLDANGNPRSLYRDARESYSTPQRQLDALEAGRNFKESDPDKLRGEYGALGSTQERRAYRVGAANSIVYDMGQKGTGDSVTKALQTPNAQTRLNALATGPDLQRLNSIADQENRMTRTRNRVQGGSPTDENRNHSGDFTIASQLGHDLAGGNILGGAAKAVAGMWRSVYRYREADASLLARDLFSTDKTAQEATLQRLEARIGARAARNAITQAVQVARQHGARAMQLGSTNNLTESSPGQNALAPSAR